VEQLNGVDTTFLNIETTTQQGHVGGIAVIDPSTAPDGWGFDTVRRVVSERIHLLPPYRRRLLTVPMGLDHPYWVDDPNFDLDYHLRHIAVPAPGGPEEVATLVARIHERPLDRTRPLWEMYIIEGLAGGKVASYTKLHHAAIDGISGAEILTILLDPSPEGREVPPDELRDPEAVPGPLALLGRTAVNMVRSPARAVRMGYELLRSVPALRPLQALPALVGLGSGREEMLSRPALIAPHTIFNEPLSAHRRWAYGDIEFSRVKAVKDAFGTTVNDVVLTITAGTVRRWLVDHGALPGRSLQAMVPISIRASDEEGAIGNRVSAMISPIGTHLEDPVERLAFVHETMAIAKDTHNAVPATVLSDFAQFAPPAVAARAARVVFDHGLAGRFTPFNLVISNIPGPQVPLFFAGARLEGHYPLSTIVDGSALNITLNSYLGRLCFGIITDRELVDDVWSMLDGIDKELAELEARIP
jgi:diacylglycerol O-acyltransferase